MADDIEASIEQFIGWFRSYMDEAELRSGVSVENSRHHRFAHYSSLYSLLESLAAVFCPNGKPGERFKNLVFKYGNWPHANYVSLPLIARYCDKRTSKAAERLSEYALSRVSSWPKFQTRDIEESDVSLEEIMSLCQIASQNESCGTGIKLWNYTHVSVLWVHRNSIIHNLRDLGGAVLPYNKEPYYSWMTIFPSEESYCEVSYPLVFVESLCRTVLSNIENELNLERVDPYSLYPFRSWFANND